MAEKTQSIETGDKSSSLSNGNAGFFGADADIAVEPAESSGYSFQRLHVQATGLVLAVLMVGIIMFGFTNFQKMENAKSAAGDYQVVNAQVVSAEPGPNNTQKLSLLWGYDNNSKVSTVELTSIGSSDKYVEHDTVSIMYTPSEFDPNTPSDGGPHFMTDQYEQMNVVTYLPYIIGSGVVALVVLLAGIALLTFMIKNVKRKETWG